ncbi:MAG TPA: class I SAM-dependent methyltransferase [Blastocatellia bacterium]|nr:class I SAM-dependent methyltransferase [Blastocatellia bacterium]
MQRVIAPTLKYSQYLYEDVLKAHVGPNTVWLDIGCGHQVLPIWRLKEEQRLASQCKLLAGIDYDMQSLKKHRNLHYKVRGSVSSLPFRDNSFNLVTANMVIEHLDNPEEQFREIARILKPEGVFIFHTPNARGYTTRLARLIPEGLKVRLIYLLDGRKEVDIFETHYRANTRKSIEDLSQRTDFKEVKVKMIASDAAFSVIPPLALLELCWIRLLMTKPFAPLRTNIIAILKR